jgi:hypothetical protein
MALIDWTWSFSDWLLLLLVIGGLLYYLGISNYNYFSKQNVPFVKPFPFVGSMGPLLRRKQYFPQLMLSVYNQLKGHPYGGFFLFKQPVVVLRDPELIKAITVKDFEHFMDHRTLFSEDGERVWSRGLFSLKGNGINVYISSMCAIYFLLYTCTVLSETVATSSQERRWRRHLTVYRWPWARILLRARYL